MPGKNMADWWAIASASSQRPLVQSSDTQEPRLLAWHMLEALYRYPKREYHTLEHIEACLHALDWFQARPGHSPASDDSLGIVAFAIFAHDCIYDSRRPDNEARSAEVGAMLATHIGTPLPAVATIRRLVLATTHLGVPADALEALIRDVDLSSLGDLPDRFDANTRAIRSEYAWASDEHWRAGRARFFRDMLARPAIYFTPEFHAAYESMARQNLERGLAALGV